MEVIQSARMLRSFGALCFSARLRNRAPRSVGNTACPSPGSARALARGSWPWALVASVLLSLTTTARADAGSEARAAFERGVEATREARWQDARREFEHSRDLVVKPSTLFNLAVADVKLGLGQEALRALDAFQVIATDQHAEMLARAKSLRAEAERLADAAKPVGERVRTLIEPTGLSPASLRLFSQGREAYADGDDKLALDSFEEAYQLSGRAELLYDIGVVADRLRDDARAITAFRGFVAEMPGVSEAALARKRIERLEQGQRERAATVVISDSSEPLPLAEQSRANLRPARALIATGVVLAAGALGSALWWADAADRVENCHRPDQVCTNEAQLDRHKAAAMATTITLAVAAVGLITGGSVWLAKRKHTPSVDVQANRERFELRVALSF